MKITWNKNAPPLGGILFAEYIKSINSNINLEVEWGNENIVDIGSKICTNSSNDICRILAKITDDNTYYGQSALEKSQVDSWLTYSLGPLSTRNDFTESIQYLNKVLTSVTHLAGKRLTIADFVVFATLYVNKHWKGVTSKKEAPVHVLRWYNYMKSISSINSALNGLSDDVKAALTPVSRLSNTSIDRNRSSADRAVPGQKIKAQEGKYVDLPGAEMGKVVVRFPPEASGYLHIGHAKAALLNQYYQQAFEGKLIMRFDDTNPAKENVHFEKVILEDVELLDIKPDMFTHTSQYFDLMLEYCEKLLKDGKAYVDDTSPELMKEQRDQRMESSNRSNSYEKNYQMWQEMVKGTKTGQQCCVRAKIDMQSLNGCMRDPTIYRCKNEIHPRTGDKYKVYPTYDFACPIVDAIEGVTHTLRTMEYHDRDPQFYWFIEALNLRKPHIWEYSRLSMTNTVLSKRKLTWFVDEGLVDGWDDPRMPTVRGVLRRGMTVEGLRQFIIAQGSSRSVVFMEWDKIWAFNKRVIDPVAPRYTVVENDSHVPVFVKGIKEEKLVVQKHPKNSDIGMKDVWTAPKILIDTCDAELLKEGENATFINWGNLLIKKLNREGGKIVSVEAEPNLENKDYKKTLKLTWLADTQKAKFTPTWCVYFDHIISKSLLGKDEDFKQFVGHETKREVKVLGDPELRNLKKGDIIQIQRKGFFRIDEPYRPTSEFTGVDQPVILFYIPDGSTKETPTSNLTASKVQTTTKKQTETTTKVKDANVINEEIVKQGDLVRTLKSQKASKDEIDSAVKELLKLKIEYKSVTNTDWKPGCAPPPQTTLNKSRSATKINEEIVKQGDLVRTLKTQKAAKGEVDSAVKMLLELKNEYKSVTNTDWKPGCAPQPSQTTPNKSRSATKINEEIVKQGDLVRTLKTQKAAKGEVDSAVKMLLELKNEYKSVTNADWKPGCVPPSDSTSNVTDNLNEKISAQGDKVRKLKSEKADKATIDVAVKILLDLKAEYKQSTGKDWSPSATPKRDTETKTSPGDENSLLEQIASQGSKIRDLKAQKADKVSIDTEVKVLLQLKLDFKNITGKEWKPGMVPATTNEISKATVEDKLLNEIALLGDNIRKLKTEKAEKSIIDVEVKKLLTLKDDFKKAAGKDWKPGMQPSKEITNISMSNINEPNVIEQTNDAQKDGLTSRITAQGETVRNLKSAKASKEEIDKAVKALLDLKSDYKNLTGTDFPVAGRTPNKTKENKPKDIKEKSKQKPVPKEKKPVDIEESSVKKQTRLGLEAKKEENFSDWYSQVITKSEMIEYYDVSGCYIFRPWSYAVWEAIKDWFDCEIKKLGVQNCYFPIFVSKSVLEKEKTHIADFAPEVAWVTKSGDSDMAEPIAVRPTSETVMYPAYAKWIQSYRDLPIKLNQWNNVVRWEFKHPQPFLRTREFLWQEGHTAYANEDDAKAEVKTILDLYARIYTDLLAIPVIKGRKTEKEKFAGGDYTYTVEALISTSGRAIQGATSHHLGQNFSKMFEIIYEDPETQEKKYIYQNSWGVTTRTIGVMIMVHGDNQGLVLPPRVASVQIVIVPCGITVNSTEKDRKELQDSCDILEKELQEVGIKVKGDYRNNYSPGWKYNYWELKGVPIRVELGPKDIKNKKLVAVRRDTGEKVNINRGTASKELLDLLNGIQQSLYDRACKDLHEHIVTLKDWEQFTPNLDKRNIIMAPFCGETTCEDKIKADSTRNDDDAEPGAPSMGAKSLCIPLEQPANISSSDKCIHPKCSNKPQFYTLFGRSY